ncbi:UNVERIFIED_CONTAM: hypothetical protein FKN15_000946 [Acipenser sinensis]
MPRTVDGNADGDPRKPEKGRGQLSYSPVWSNWLLPLSLSLSLAYLPLSLSLLYWNLAVALWTGTLDLDPRHWTVKYHPSRPLACPDRTHTRSQLSVEQNPVSNPAGKPSITIRSKPGNKMMRSHSFLNVMLRVLTSDNGKEKTSSPPAPPMGLCSERTVQRGTIEYLAF